MVYDMLCFLGTNVDVSREHVTMNTVRITTRFQMVNVIIYILITRAFKKSSSKNDLSETGICNDCPWYIFCSLLTTGKRVLQNIYKSVKKCWHATSDIMMYVTYSNLQPHNSVVEDNGLFQSWIKRTNVTFPM